MDREESERRFMQWIKEELARRKARGEEVHHIPVIHRWNRDKVIRRHLEHVRRWQERHRAKRKRRSE